MPDIKTPIASMAGRYMSAEVITSSMPAALTVKSENAKVKITNRTMGKKKLKNSASGVRI